ncbi:MAG: hypothetical protein ACK5GU_07040 [Chloroflexota bacterium]|jgi:hypothetical protein
MAFWGSRIRSIDAGQILLGVLFVLSLIVSLPRVYATDEVQYYAWLRSVWFDGDVDFANEYTTFAHLNPNSGITESILKTDRIRAKTGLYGNIAPVGSAILWAPWFITTDLLLRGLHLTGVGLDIPADGYSWPYQRAISYASAIYAFIGLLITYRMAHQWSSVFSARLATLGIWLATPLVFYMTIQMPFAHANGFFVTTCFIYCWLATQQHRQSIKWWAVLGVSAGGMFLVREQLILFAILPATSALLTLIRHIRTSQIRALGPDIRAWAMATVCAIAMLTPQIAAYWLVNGEPRPASEVSGKLNLCSPHAIDTLIDFDTTPEPICNVGPEPVKIQPYSRGALVWSPILAFALLGLSLFAYRIPKVGVPFLLAFMLQVWINGAFGTTWHLSGAFGFRRLIECSALFVIGLSYLLTKLEQRVHWSVLVVGITAFIGWNMGLIVNATIFNGETNLRRGLTWPDLWRWQLELPMKLWQKGLDIFDRCRYIKNSC